MITRTAYSYEGDTLRNNVLDFMRPDEILRLQMRGRQLEGTLGSGAKTITLSMGQLIRLETLTKGSDDPVDQGMRLLLDLDDLQSDEVSAGQTGSCQY